MPLPDDAGYLTLEQVIASNLKVLFTKASRLKYYFFHATQGAKDNPWEHEYLEDLEVDLAPGYIIGMVTAELKACKSAYVERLQVSADMPKKLQRWITEQLKADLEYLLPTEGLLSVPNGPDTVQLEGYQELRDPPHEPVPETFLRY